MRIYLSSGHKYPGWRYGCASHAVHDYLARGLAELGHEVHYHLKESSDARLPKGIVSATGIRGDEDILHINHLPLSDASKLGQPWVRSVHSDLLGQGFPVRKARQNFIFVSQKHANYHSSDRFVHNGIDPADFIYVETKDDYFLFIVAGDLPKAKSKGLDIALRISKWTGIRLRVAGGPVDIAEMAEFEGYCRANGADCVGIVNGERKAELFAGAKALLFPTQVNEAFGMPLAEALMSGTPVIASDKGAMPELLPPSVGFVCSNIANYLDAVAKIKHIAPQDCRELALNRYHYLAMARSYLKEYQREIEDA